MDGITYCDGRSWLLSRTAPRSFPPTVPLAPGAAVKTITARLLPNRHHSFHLVNEPLQAAKAAPRCGATTSTPQRRSFTRTTPEAITSRTDSTGQRFSYLVEQPVELVLRHF